MSSLQGLGTRFRRATLTRNADGSGRQSIPSALDGRPSGTFSHTGGYTAAGNDITLSLDKVDGGYAIRSQRSTGAHSTREHRGPRMPFTRP
jgi:hypothetical protein